MYEDEDYSEYEEELTEWDLLNIDHGYSLLDGTYDYSDQFADTRETDLFDYDCDLY